jgi:tetrahydromethanopterin S-methyltransferase subunit G
MANTMNESNDKKDDNAVSVDENNKVQGQIDKKFPFSNQNDQKSTGKKKWLIGLLCIAIIGILIFAIANNQSSGQSTAAGNTALKQNDAEYVINLYDSVDSKDISERIAAIESVDTKFDKLDTSLQKAVYEHYNVHLCSAGYWVNSIGRHMFHPRDDIRQAYKYIQELNSVDINLLNERDTTKLGDNGPIGGDVIADLENAVNTAVLTTEQYKLITDNVDPEKIKAVLDREEWVNSLPKENSSSNASQSNSSSNNTSNSNSAKNKPVLPKEYENALYKADSYANDLHLSKKDVYDQLTSKDGENFSSDAAQYAIDNVQADWNNNALIKARSYQNDLHMSINDIYEQLTASYGEQFTSSEAQYAIDHLQN